MRKIILNLPLAALAMLAAAGFGGSAAALAQAVVGTESGSKGPASFVLDYIDLGVGAGIATNPRLGPSSTVSGVGRVSAYAVHSVSSERDTLQLSAYAENQSYTNDYGSTQAFEIAASGSHKATPRLSLFGNARFRGDVGGQLYNRFVSVPVAPPPVDFNNPLPPVNVLDPAFVSLNRTQYTAAGQAGLRYAVSARDSINGSVGYQHAFFGGNGANLDYDVLTGTAGWERQFSARTTAGLRMLVQRSDFGAVGHTTVFSPQVTARTTLAEGWNAAGAVGVSFVDQETTTSRGSSTDLSFDASLCRETEKESICGHASRAAQTSIGQNVFTYTSASLSYYRRLGANDTVQASASIARSSGQNALLTGNRATYYAGSAAYNRKLTPRLSAGVEGQVSKIDQSGANVPAQASAMVYLRYRLGDLM